MRLPLPDRRLAALTAAALLAVSLAACSSDGGDAAGELTAKPSSTSASTKAPDTAKPGSSTDPNSPFVVAASAVAQRSRDQVTQLHAMGVGTTGQGQLPTDQIPHLAKAIDTELGTQIADCTMMPPPKGSPAADLVTALRDYRALAQDLADWEPGEASIGASWFTRLEGADEDWKAALRQLGKLSDQDLLAGLAPLLMPS